MDDRSTGIGASDIAAIIGANPYKTPYAVFAEKTGLVTVPENEAMTFGKRKQRLIAQIWAERHNADIEWLDVTYRLEKPLEFIMATPDSRLVKSNEGLEVKVTGWRQKDRWGEENTDQIPTEYLLQAHYQTLVMGWERVYVAVEVGGTELAEYVVEADPEMQAMLKDRALQFWKDFIEPKHAPPLDWSDAATAALRKRFPKVVEKSYRDATMAEEDLVRELALLKRSSKAAAELYEAQLNKVKEAIGDQKGLQGRGFVVSWYDVKGSTYMVERKPGRSFRARGELFDTELKGEE